MNKSILILLFYHFFLTLNNNLNSSILNDRILFLYGKNKFSIINSFFYYFGTFLGNYYFYFKKKTNNFSIVLSLNIWLLNLIMFFLKNSHNIFFIIFLRILNGLVYNTITNYVELYINFNNKKNSIFYNSITYFSTFLNQSINNYLKLIYFNYEEIINITILILMIFLEKFIFLIKNINLEQNNISYGKKLNNFNLTTAILFSLTTTISMLMCNYINDLVLKGLHIAGYFVPVCASISYFYINLFDKNKKELILKSLIFMFFLIYLIEFFFYYKFIVFFFLFFFCLSTYTIYYLSNNLIDEFIVDQSNIIYSMFSCINYSYYYVFFLLYFKKHMEYFFLLVKFLFLTLFFLILFLT